MSQMIKIKKNVHTGHIEILLNGVNSIAWSIKYPITSTILRKKLGIKTTLLLEIFNLKKVMSYEIRKQLSEKLKGKK